jgi:hypothetical protein
MLLPLLQDARAYLHSTVHGTKMRGGQQETMCVANAYILIDRHEPCSSDQADDV